MNGTRNWCTLADVHPEGQTAGSVDILRLTLQSELTGDELEHIAQKPGLHQVGRGDQIYFSPRSWRHRCPQ
uniref:Tuftelin 1 n=1 Tax=Equus asinus TaxID=9793 RepID=A0A9L0IY37_EQUAS